MIKRVLGFLFLGLALVALWNCARRGSPTGGPKDVTPPVLVKAEPPNLSTHFTAKKIRLYFDEYIKLDKVQDQLIVSPPLKNNPELTPQGTPRKYVEIVIKDTLKPNTTYTFNFGQSIVDNNEGNPNRFFTYVFSTGDYIDSLSLAGVVKDAFNKKADQFISVMLYEIDSTYTDSTVYKRPPNYMTNTLDSTVFFNLQYLKAGKYALIGLKDKNKNNMFDQGTDKIGFIQDTVVLPTDSIYLLNLFQEIPDYRPLVPSYAAKNRIMFGFNGETKDVTIKSLTTLPDTVRTTVLPERDRDTLNYWFTPFEMDSLRFEVTNNLMKTKDTFTVKPRKLPVDTLVLSQGKGGVSNFVDDFEILANTPLVKIDTSLMEIIGTDTLTRPFTARLDTLKNKVALSFTKEANQRYLIHMLPGAIEDFFGEVNDTLSYAVSLGSLADYGNLRVNLAGHLEFPLLVQLTDEKGNQVREVKLTEKKRVEFLNLEPKNYVIRVIFDANGNGRWDTGSFLEKRQPERVSYYPGLIEMRANWEKEETFRLLD